MENDYEKTQLGAADANATQMTLAPGAEATQMSVSVTCPVCGSTTPGGEQYCSDCGFLLSSTPVDVGEAPTSETAAKLIESPGGREFFLNPGENSIGRENADVLIAHPTVSRKHAKLTVGAGKYMLEDLGSTNGTYAGATKVEPGQPVEVKPGDEMRIGSVSLTLSVPETTEAEEEPSLFDAEPAEEVCEVLPQDAETAPAEEPEPVEVEEETLPVAKLIAKAGGDEFAIKPGENTIGRRPSNSIVVADAFTSGSHAIIIAEEDKFTITDVGSTNGTFVNGERLAPNEPRELGDGDEITFGQPVFRFTL